jgi:dimethylaniline monooxygenase (N-oxide forming)
LKLKFNPFCLSEGAIDGVDGKKVYFSDGTQAEVDVIIECTGYNTEFLFLPPKYQIPLINNYKFIFNVEDPSLAFVGYVRPIVGSIPLISEFQARYAARVFSGAVHLPENGDLVNETNKDTEFWSDYFKGNSKRISTLVEMYTYADDIGNKTGKMVSHLELFKDSPRDWLTSVLSPACANYLRLTTKGDEREKALANLRRRGEGCFSPIHLLLIMLFRFIWFDWWMGVLGKVKYMFQTNKFCKKIQKHPVVRFLDWVWTTPKRWLFDNKTRAP